MGVSFRALLAASRGIDSNLAAPSNLTATPDGGYQTIDLSWTDNADAEDGFKIERSADASLYWQIATVGAGVEAYSDTGLVAGQTYYYRVRAYNGDGNGNYSNVATGTVFDVGDVSGLILDINPDSEVLDAGGGSRSTHGNDVGFVGDQSGNSNDFSQATAGYKPHLNAGASKGHNAIRFDGADDYLARAGNFSSTAEGAVFAVFRLVAALQDTQYLLSSSDEATANYFWTTFAYEDSVDPNIRVDQKNNDTLDANRGDTDMVAESLYVAVYRSSGTAYVLRLNENVEGIGTASGSDNGDWVGDVAGRDNWVIGALKRLSVGGLAKMDLLRLLYYNANPSDANTVKIEQALVDLYTERTRTELFLDDQKIISNSASRTVNKPTKYGSNPVIETGVNGATWDYQKIYAVAYLIGGTYYAWCAAAEFDAPNTDYPTYLTSADGYTWTKPNLGFVTYSGDTDNNILLDGDIIITDMYYDADAPSTQVYVLLAETDGATSGLYLYTSADGTNFSAAKTITDSDAYGQAIEGKAIVRRPDGRWLVYYTVGHLADDREIGVYLSDSDDITGTWTDQGIVIGTAASTAQKYGIGVEYQDGIYLGYVSIYNSTAETTDMDLYVSRNGLDWSVQSTEWIPLGAGTEWDDSLIFNGRRMVKVDNVWRFYYCGSPVTHDTARPKDMRMGLATIPYQRIGQVGTNGEVVTRDLLPGTGAVLYVNADASGGGSLDVEVLDAATDLPVAGFEDTDCDTITSDTYSTEVTWAASSLPTGSRIKLKFYLTNATLYAYWVE